MKKKILILALSVICLALLLGGMLAVNADEGAATDIPGHTLALEEGVHIVYYVDQTVPAGAEAGLLCWEAPQESYTLENKQHQLFQNGTYTRGGNTYARYELPLPAKKMTVDIYAVSYVKVGDTVIYSELDKYSVLQYCYNKKGSTSVLGDGTATLGELVTDILNYGKTAQKYFNCNTGRLANADYYQISVENGTLEDGTTAGLYQTGETISLKAAVPSGYQITWKNSAGTVVGKTAELVVSAAAKAETYTATVEANHNYGDWIIDQESTCTVNGSKHKTCADCGDTVVEEILAPGHVYVSHSKITPTCTEPGMKAHYTCSTCGAYFTATRQETTKEALKISELGHLWNAGVVTLEPTATAAGILTYTCLRCGATQTEPIQPLGEPYTREDDYILFGSYPQSEVTDSTLKATLNVKAGTLPTADDAQAWTSYGYYDAGVVSDYMWYIDIHYNGETYRGVYFNKYRPYRTDGSYTGIYMNENCIQFQYYSKGTVYWFQYEPLKWMILSDKGGKALILCENIIDSQQFDTSSNNYEYSEIRAWLNDIFYETAFNSLQKALIETTLVDNSARSTNPERDATEWNDGANPYACNDTEDKIFLLSEQEVTNSAYGFNSDPMAHEEDDILTRQKQPTAYAKVQGAYTNPDGNGSWWLRSPARFSKNAIIVFPNGYASTIDSVNHTGRSVVPALQIRLN